MYLCISIRKGIKMLLKNEDKKIIEKAEEITKTDYSSNHGIITCNDMLCIVRDLLEEIEHLHEQIENVNQDIHDNYRRIPVSEQFDCERCERDYL